MNTTTQSQVPARVSLDALLSEVCARERDLIAYLPEGVRPERFMALARRAIQEQPALAECSADSVLRALRECAMSGLELDGQFSSIIVRKSKQGRPIATWDASFRGQTWLALASGHVRGIEAQVVREADEFSVELGSDPRLVHRPNLTTERGPVVAAYAVAILTSGAKLIEVLTREDIRRIRAVSPAGDKGPWGNWDDEMTKKSALRRLLKRLPAGSARSLPAMSMLARLHGTAESGGTERERERERRPTPSPLLPEDEHQLECAALERLSAATTLSELDAAWAQAQLEHLQRGAPVAIAVEARWHELREHLAGEGEQ